MSYIENIYNTLLSIVLKKTKYFKINFFLNLKMSTCKKRHFTLPLVNLLYKKNVANHQK